MYVSYANYVIALVFMPTVFSVYYIPNTALKVHSAN